MSEKEVKKIILKILGRYLDPKKTRIFLFGSRSSGFAGKWSDYDVGLEGENPFPLRVLGLIKTDLQESDLPVHVEVVDFRQVDKKFKKFALKSAQLWKIT